MKKRFSDEQVIRILREAESREGSVQASQHLGTDVLSLAQQVRWHGCGRRPPAQGSGIGERAAQAPDRRAIAGHRRPEGIQPKKISTPTGRREALEVLTRRGLSQRKACCYLGLSRRVATYTLRQPEKDRSLSERLIAATQEVPRFGYRRMSAWLALGESRVRRMWRALQLNIPRRRPRRRRCGNDIRLPGATQPNSVWSDDFVHDQLMDGRALKVLCVIDEFTRECLAIEVGASLRSQGNLPEKPV